MFGKDSATLTEFELHSRKIEVESFDAHSLFWVMRCSTWCSSCIQ
jgi:hypothetical protein